MILRRTSDQNGAMESFRIVGVAPSDFRYVRGYERGALEMLTPLRTPRQTYMVRLRAGAPVAFAEQRITEAVKSVGTAFPPNWNGAHLESVHERYVAELKPMLKAILVAVGIVLVIVCVLLGIKLKQGRDFMASDRPESEPVAIISASLAQRLWPNESAPGKRLRTVDQTASNAPLTVWRTIVGVAHDVRQTYTDTDQHDVYLPFLQVSSRYAPVFIRSDQPPAFWLKTLRDIVAEIDPTALIGGGTALDEQAQKQLAGPRFLMSVLLGFALFATFTALLGIYGVTAYAVQQREREGAIRIALGATPGAILRLFLRQGGLVLALGIIGGLFASAAVAKTLASQLYGVPQFDVVTLAGACAVRTKVNWWTRGITNASSAAQPGSRLSYY